MEFVQKWNGIFRRLFHDWILSKKAWFKTAFVSIMKYFFKKFADEELKEIYPNALLSFIFNAWITEFFKQYFPFG